MASILDVVNGISQAISAKHHGGAQIGLKRETEDLLQGCSIYDPRIMDGFGVQYQGDMLILKYHSEMPLTAVHDKNFETDVRQTMKDIKKFLEKEYRKVTKKSLDLTEIGDTNILIQSANRRTSYVNAIQNYKLGGLDGFSKEDSKPQQNYSDIAKRWLMNTRKPQTYLKENVDVQDEGIKDWAKKAAAGAALVGTLAGAGTAKAEPTSQKAAASQEAVASNEAAIGYIEAYMSQNYDSLDVQQKSDLFDIQASLRGVKKKLSPTAEKMKQAALKGAAQNPSKYEAIAKKVRL